MEMAGEHAQADPENLLYQAWGSIHRSIAERYKQPRPLHEAKKDALAYVASSLAWYKMQSCLTPDSQILNKRAQRADKTIEDAINGNWNTMREYLQAETRDAFRLAGGIGDSSVITAQQESGKQVEQRAESLVNLAKSLNT